MFVRSQLINQTYSANFYLTLKVSNGNSLYLIVDQSWYEHVTFLESNLLGNTTQIQTEVTSIMDPNNFEHTSPESYQDQREWEKRKKEND